MIDLRALLFVLITALPATANPLAPALYACTDFVLCDRPEGRATSSQGFAAGGVIIERTTRTDTTENHYECRLFGMTRLKGNLVLDWPTGAAYVSEWLAESPTTVLTLTEGWSELTAPVLGRGNVQVVAQPLHVISATDPFHDASAETRPVEIIVTRSGDLCERNTG